MFTFKPSVCAVLALLSVKGVQGRPVDLQDIASMVQSALHDRPGETSVSGTDSASKTGSASTSASGIFTIVTSPGGSAITLAESGSKTVWNGATFTIDVDGAAATSNSPNTSSAASTHSGSVSTDSASASTTTPASSAASSRGSSVSSAPSSAKSSPSSSTSTKPNGSTGLKPVGISTPLARSLLTVAVGIVFGAWCL
ncbi:hypothetical protein B0H19DRAFT_1365996 [Mycena capillaripes]|nr:hypothetical protein B0H19DRAFT_1365996 [Mycena capillaripes]